MWVLQLYTCLYIYTLFMCTRACKWIWQYRPHPTYMVITYMVIYTNSKIYTAISTYTRACTYTHAHLTYTPNAHTCTRTQWQAYNTWLDNCVAHSSQKCTHTHTRSHTQGCACCYCTTWQGSLDWILGTANPTRGDIFECCLIARSSKLQRLFSLKRGKRDVRALSFELSKMTPKVGLAVDFSGCSALTATHCPASTFRVICV